MDYSSVDVKVLKVIQAINKSFPNAKLKLFYKQNQVKGNTSVKELTGIDMGHCNSKKDA